MDEKTIYIYIYVYIADLLFMYGEGHSFLGYAYPMK